MTNALRDAALDYAKRGWPVFPLKPQGKTPLTTHGHKEATTSINMIERWWDRWPDANVGVATGKALGAWVLDVDGEEGSRSLTALEQELGGLPDTLESATGGGGRHLFWAWNDARPVGNRTNVRPGIDVRGEGGYVVAPPSIHPSGRVYDWLLATAPVRPPLPRWVDLVSPRALAPWERPATAAPEPRPARAVAAMVGATATTDRARRYLAEIPPAIQGQGGHNALLWAARAMVVGFDLDDATALALLWAEFNPRCQPPWDADDEAQRKDFERKVLEARRTPGEKPQGWLLDDLGLRSSAEALAQVARGGQLAARLLAREVVADPRDYATPTDPPPPPAGRRDFPVHLFPRPIREYCEQVANSHDVDLSFAALPILVTAGAAMGNAWRLQIKDGWVFNPTLWGALVAPPSYNKTGPLAEITEPAYDPVPVDRILNPILNPAGRLMVQNVTVEALLTILAANPRGTLCFHNELAGWIEGFDRGGKKGSRGPDESAWLSFWDAGRYMIDRKTNNESVSIPAAASSVLGGIQPGVFAECFNPKRFASGLVPRLLIAFPPVRMKRWRTEVVTEAARNTWIDTLQWLRATPFRQLDPQTGRLRPRIVVPTPEAEARYVAFCESLWAAMFPIKDENELSLWGKANTQAGRLALVLHGLSVAVGERDLGAPVSLASMDGAIDMARWFLEEQRLVYGFGAAVIRRENAVAAAAELRERFAGEPVIAVRDVQRRMKGWHCDTAEKARAVLAGLVEFGQATWDGPKQRGVVLAPEEKK